MQEIMLNPLNEEYLKSVITAMSFEVRAFIVSLLRQKEYQGELDLERLAKAAELQGSGLYKENFIFHLKGALAPFLDSKVLEADDKHRKERTGYRFNDDGYNDLAAAVNVAYDITNRLMTVDDDDRFKKSIPYILTAFRNPLVFIWLAEVFSSNTVMLEKDVVEILKGYGVSRSSLNNQLPVLEECGVLKISKEKAEVKFGESERHEEHQRRILRRVITLTQSGQEVFRYLRDLKLFVRADPEFFPRDDRIEVLRGNYPIDNRKRILYVSANGDRTEDIVAKIKNLDWNIDIYRMLLRVERVDVKEFRQMQPKRLGGYDLVVLDGFCGCEDARSMASTYNTLKSQQGSNGTAAILLTPNETLGDNIERESPINYIFITDNHGNLDVRKLQEIMYKLMANQKSVKKAQFYCK